jgi:uncharacterized protein
MNNNLSNNQIIMIKEKTGSVLPYIRLIKILMKVLPVFVILSFLASGSFGQESAQFSESELVLKTPTGDISGTLISPNNASNSPVVLIIAGSGPTDRDGNSPLLGLQTNAYKMLATGFAQNGISTVRYDKRGIGKSKSAMTKESDVNFETYIDDAVSWISLLKSDKRFSKVIVLGHSEGSLVGMAAVQKAGISAFVSMAGAGRSIDKILEEQLKTKLPPQLMTESNKILDTLKMGKTVKNVSQSLMMLYRPSVQPFMISWLKYDPAKEISRLKIPVLIIQGTTDIQVGTEDARLLSASKTDAKLRIIENMNHVMKECDNDLQKNYATYNNPELPLKQGLIEEIVSFIKEKS